METITEQERREIQDKYKNETGDLVINSQGEFDIDYVAWLEQQVKNSVVPDVSNCGGAIPYDSLSDSFKKSFDSIEDQLTKNFKMTEKIPKEFKEEVVGYKDARSFLSKCSIKMLRYLELQLNFANDIRRYQLEYGVSNKEMAEAYGCAPSKIKKLRKGACTISLKDMSILRTLYARRIAEDKAKLQINSTHK